MNQDLVGSLKELLPLVTALVGAIAALISAVRKPPRDPERPAVPTPVGVGEGTRAVPTPVPGSPSSPATRRGLGVLGVGGLLLVVGSLGASAYLLRQRLPIVNYDYVGGGNDVHTAPADGAVFAFARATPGTKLDVGIRICRNASDDSKECDCQRLPENPAGEAARENWAGSVMSVMPIRRGTKWSVERRQQEFVDYLFVPGVSAYEYATSITNGVASCQHW